MALVAGIAGARRNGAVALWGDRGTASFCEEERATRSRRAGLRPGSLPFDALDQALRAVGYDRGQVETFAVGEAAIELPPTLRVERVDHHLAHAATAFHTGPFDTAIVLVCDRHGSPELSVWRGAGTALERLPFRWSGPAFASLYSQAAEALGFAASGEEHRLEALARIAPRVSDVDGDGLRWQGDRLQVDPGWQADLAAAKRSNGQTDPTQHLALLAARVQHRLGEVLLKVVAAIKQQCGGEALCLAGGLFYNSYFTTLVAESGPYAQVFVPVNPGAAGAALGAAFVVGGAPAVRAELSPFLGPEYAAHEIKATLDNCKLSYDYLHQDALIDRVAGSLSAGRLVGWFQGRMEWGTRALGNRSILASPVDRYVLENLNGFLKHRESHRGYSVSVAEEAVGKFFRGPARSASMEYEYEVVDPTSLQHLLPLGSTRLRVQTVPASAGAFYRLIQAHGQLTGVPILVNTSYNGFNEPIVCSPRDAVRVFYGTGLDLAVLGNLVLQK